MAVQSAAKGKPVNRSTTSSYELFTNSKVCFAFALLFIDALLVALIISYVPYTKIDWDAYMSQVSGFLDGERDYRNLKGDTGPLVYPAGFLYIYSAIRFVTGGRVYPAQILFGILYVLNLAIVLFIYVKTNVLPWWALSLLCLSKRVHSIFVLRLFNDCFAMTLLHAALALLLYQKWHLGLIIFSGAVSVKMNVLLYAPPLLLLMLKAMDIAGVFSALAGAALVQILLGLPFLLAHPTAYISGAFNLGRVFIHFCGASPLVPSAIMGLGTLGYRALLTALSVNFKFVAEPVFVSKAFALSLLITHLILLGVFAHYRWCKHEGGLLNFLHFTFAPPKLRGFVSSCFSLKHSVLKLLSPEHIVTTMFVGNFIGILCARSLHYQFYSWYFYSLPYLLWKTSFPTLLRLMLFAVVELCWNVYPSNMYSSLVLLCVHSILLWGLWAAPPEYPYLDGKPSAKNKRK